MLPVLLPNAKPNNSRFRNRAPKVSLLIRLVAVQTSGAARAWHGVGIQRGSKSVRGSFPDGKKTGRR